MDLKGRNFLTLKDFTKEEIEYFPWYMVMFYQREKEPEHYIYEVDLSDLQPMGTGKMEFSPSLLALFCIAMRSEETAGGGFCRYQSI